MYARIAVFFVLASTALPAQSQSGDGAATSTSCTSFGTDFINTQGPYCINTTSTDYFTFGTKFFGCSPSDSQGDVIPIVVDPNEDSYYCSGIPTRPDGQQQLSSCNQTGNVLTKNLMTSGTYNIVIEGLTFAYVRAFEVIARAPSTVTVTPTLTYSSTTTPTVTATPTVVITVSQTLQPTITVVPWATVTVTKYVQPAAITNSILSTTTVNIDYWSIGVLPHTTVQTTTCPVATQIADATYTGAVGRKGSGTSSAPSTKSTSTSNQRRYQPADRKATSHLAPRDGGVIPGPDVCTTTLVASTSLPITTVIVTAPASTLTAPVTKVTTTTITPPAITINFGFAVQTVTVTLAPFTFLPVRMAVATATNTQYLLGSYSSTVKVNPSGARCV